MSSPFPGMDPYIEHPEVWSDFQGALAEVIRSQLNETIRPRYVARMTPHMTYETVEIETRRAAYPDVGLWQPQPPAGHVVAKSSAIAPAPVMSLVVAELPLRLYTVEIRQVETMKLITAIEILSQSTRRPPMKPTMPICASGRKYSAPRRTSWKSICCVVAHVPLTNTRTGGALLCHAKPSEPTTLR